MIKTNSKVIIKELHKVLEFGTSDKPTAEGVNIQQDKVMVVEGLYYMDKEGFNQLIKMKIKPTIAKCIWYNTKNELQTEYINLEILIEL